ncbi:MAG: hypothetical protein ABW032_09210, partial [Burkholderiaceae bacterium]
VAVGGGRALRLLSAKTGLWLSGAITAKDLTGFAKDHCPAEDADENPNADDRSESIDDVTLLDDGAVAARVGDCWFRRAAPFTAAQAAKAARDIHALADPAVPIERFGQADAGPRANGRTEGGPPARAPIKPRSADRTSPASR